MSHTATYDIKISNIQKFLNIAGQLGHKIKLPREGQKIMAIKQYGQNWINDAVASVHLQKWRYPIAIRANGEILYDHWGSAAETMDYLGQALQTYNEAMVMGNIDYSSVNMVNQTTNIDNGDKVITLVY